MTNRIEHITVVGGGTAGWLSAMILNRFLNTLREGPPVRISVIESPRIPTVGVGESTVIAMSRLLQQLGIDEAAFIKRTNASFKLSVRFEGWNLDDEGEPISFYHPFNNPGFLSGLIPAYHYNKYGPAEGSYDFADSMVVNPSIIRAYKGPRHLGSKDYEAAIGYSYHLDAALFGQFLREVALERGIEHIADDVAEVELGDDGSVSVLHLTDSGAFPVEFVVDCTGFKSLILQQALGEPFESFSDRLFCDRAIPLQIPMPTRPTWSPAPGPPPWAPAGSGGCRSSAGWARAMSSPAVFAATRKPRPSFSPICARAAIYPPMCRTRKRRSFT